ncbi:DUF262 domain-containing protein [Hoeflea alexandrii]
MYQTGGTLKETLQLVGKRKYVLPAIQREFVWKPEQICKLFDSLMQGYPFGTFLLWLVNEENTGKYKFYEFMRHYHERDNAHCKPLEDQPTGPLTAVLDGQQRLTALNIGLRGSMTLKLPNRWWNNPSAFPKKQLYLNLLKSGEADEEGIKYEFSFLTEERSKEITPDECWFRVPDILDIDDAPAMLAWVNSRLPQVQTNQAFKVLNQLYQVVHNKVLVAYYEEKSQDLGKVLNIFIRTNSGGTVLSYSDLLLSIAVAQWSKHDARDEIHALVDQLNDIGQGFAFSKDLVLKAGLMLSDIGNVGFKVENFNRENMEILESKWTGVKDALLLTTQLIASFGFSGQTLRADSAILPIAYYLHQLAPGDAYLTQTKYQADRQAIRDWFIRSLLKASGIWGSGLDTLLTALRDAIKEHGKEAFPHMRIREVMARRGKTLNFEPEEIEELADMAYGDKRLFALLTLIFPFVDTGYNFHIDHIFPKAIFNKRNLEKNDVAGAQIEDFKGKSERLGNLQLLLGAINNEKRKKMPAEWLTTQYPDAAKREAQIEAHMLGEVPTEIGQFDSFYTKRRDELRDEIASLLGADSRTLR